MHKKYFKFVISLALIFIVISNGILVDPTSSGKYIQLGQKANALANDPYTKLLMHFDGSNGSTAFNDEYGKTVTPCGNAQISTAQSKFGEASGYFDGINSYISIPSSPDFDFGTGDFTIDWWEYRISTRPYMTSVGHGGTATGMLLNYDQGDGTTDIYCYWEDGTSNRYQFYNTVPLTGSWNHFAVVRSGTTLYGFVNGVCSMIQTGVTKALSKFGEFDIGRWQNSTPDSYFNGYIDELRVSKGIARWTKKFTLDDEYTKLLMHFDGMNGSKLFTDESGKIVTLCGNPQISTVQSKFGGASGYFNGNSYLTVPRSENFEFGSGDFTIDCWINISAFSNDDSSNELAIFHGCPISTPDNDTYYLSVSKYYKTLQFACSTNGGTTWNVNLFGTTVLQTNRWYHVAVVRNSSCLKIYLNGIQEASTSISGSIHIPGAYWTYVGIGTYCPGLGSPYRKNFNGYIDELRVSKGIARWTSNFTPPNSPYGLKLSKPRSSQCTITSNDKIYILGGSNTITGGAVKTVEEYNPFAIQMTNTANMLSSSADAGAAELNGKIYIASGINETDLENRCLKTLQVYDPSTDTWVTKQDMGIPRKSLGLAAVNDKIYAFGGVNNTGILDSAEVYNPSDNTWSNLPNKMPVPRAGFAITVCGNKIYLIGGYNKDGEYLNSVDVYDPGANTWTTLQMPMPTARTGCEAVTLNDRIYVLGGWNGSYLNTVEIYDPATEQWTVGNPFSIARTDFGTAVLGTKIYIIGGNNYYAGGYLDSVEEYDSM